MANNAKQWMGVTSSDYSMQCETKWSALKETIVALTADAMTEVAKIKFVEVKSGPSAGEKKVVVNLFSEPGEPMPTLWFRADYPMQAIAEDGDVIKPESVRFYFLVATEEEAEYPIAKQALEFLEANYDSKVIKAVKKLAEQHPVILACTGRVA